jgi:predicted AAA+ superfamily ATPase
MNWDDLGNRERILKGHLPSSQPVVILDEIHKFAGWRKLVKGYYDRHKGKMGYTSQSLETGTARNRSSPVGRILSPV